MLKRNWEEVECSLLREDKRTKRRKKREKKVVNLNE
jgi:hypothetical protein